MDASTELHGPLRCPVDFHEKERHPLFGWLTLKGTPSPKKGKRAESTGQQSSNLVCRVPVSSQRRVQALNKIRHASAEGPDGPTSFRQGTFPRDLEPNEVVSPHRTSGAETRNPTPETKKWLRPRGAPPSRRSRGPSAPSRPSRGISKPNRQGIVRGTKGTSKGTRAPSKAQACD